MMWQQSLELFSAKCPSTSNFLGFPNWYRGLECSGGRPEFSHINELWVIVANITQMVLQAAGIIAVGFIIYGGIMYIVSQGNPDQMGHAKNILTNAIIGLVIALFATVILSFVAGIFS